jgi:hypothetical protein
VAAHLITFTAQIIITAFVLGLIWRLFYTWRLRAFKKDVEGQLTEIRGMVDDVYKQRDHLREFMRLHKDAAEKTNIATKLALEEIKRLKVIPPEASPLPSPFREDARKK